MLEHTIPSDLLLFYCVSKRESMRFKVLKNKIICMHDHFYFSSNFKRAVKHQVRVLVVWKVHTGHLASEFLVSQWDRTPNKKSPWVRRPICKV